MWSKELRPSNDGKVKNRANLFCEALVWASACFTTVVICMPANLPATVQRLVNAENHKPVVGVDDWWCAPAYKVGAFGFVRIQVNDLTL